MSEREIREIQLSGKQIGFVAISVIAVLVVVFLLGVSVGRGVRSSMDPAALSAAGTTDTVVAPEATPTPAQPTQELGYHDLLAGTGGSGAKPTVEPSAPPTPITEPTTTPAPTPTPTPAEAAPPQGNGWFVQVGAFTGRQAADGLAESVKKLGLTPFVLVPGANSVDRFYRVRLGPYGTQAEAEGVRVRLVREGYSPRVQR